MKTFLLPALTLLLLITGCGAGFDASEWKAHNSFDEPDNPRYRMTGDLQQNVLKKDLTEEEVLDLLGEPGERGPGDDGATLLTYPVGWNTVIDQKPVFFIVEIGADGKYSGSWVKEE